MKNIKIVYSLAMIPGVLSLFIPGNLPSISYDLLSASIISLFVFSFAYLIGRFILKYVDIDLERIAKAVAFFFIVNGILFFISCLIHSLNITLSLFSIAYGLGIIIAIKKAYLKS